MVPTSKPNYSYNANPRLSANQLAEYLTASSTRRKSIIRDARFPKTAIVAHYKGARDTIGAYLCDNGRSTSIIVDGIEQQKAREGRVGAKDWIKNDSRISIEAIERFHGLYNRLGLRRIECRAPMSAPNLKMEGVEVSVNLDATTHRTDKDGKNRVGGIVLSLAKSEQSTRNRQERSRSSAVLVAQFAEVHLKPLGEMDTTICFAFDVFGGKLIRAPSSYVKRLDNMRASCEEIAARWRSIEPPDDYDGPGPG
jgi:hypothetical protein